MEGDRIAKSLGIYAEKYSKSRRSVDLAGGDDVSRRCQIAVDPKTVFHPLVVKVSCVWVLTQPVSIVQN